jgi:hypothetical protein
MTEGIYKATIRQADQTLMILLTDGLSRSDVATRLQAEGHDVRQVVEAAYRVAPFEGEVIYD